MKRDYLPFLPKIKQLSMRRDGVERASALASLISWIIEMGLEFPMVRSELNSPSVTNPGEGTIMYTMCPPGCYHNGFMATPELGHRMYGYTLLDCIVESQECSNCKQ